METKLIKVNEQYYQLYSTFSKSEMKDMFDNVLDMTNEKNKFDDLSQTRKAGIVSLVKERIESVEILNEVTNSDIPFMSEMIHLYRGQVRPDLPLFVISKMCAIVDELDIELPDSPIDMRKYRVPLKLVNGAIERILIHFNQYKEEFSSSVNESTKKIILRVVKADKIEDRIIYHKQEDKLDFSKLYGYKVNEFLPEDVTTKLGYIEAQIQDIIVYKVNEITDEIAKRMSFLGTYTKKDFLHKTRTLIVQSEKRTQAVKLLLDMAVDSSNIVLANEVIEHMMQLMANHLQIPIKEIKRQMDLDKENAYLTLKNQIFKKYIIHYATTEYQDMPYQQFYGIIKDEQALHSILGLIPRNLNRYELFYRETMDNLILLQFFINENAIII